jgi:hypothetical protein
MDLPRIRKFLLEANDSNLDGLTQAATANLIWAVELLVNEYEDQSILDSRHVIGIENVGGKGSHYVYSQNPNRISESQSETTPK